MTNAEMLVENKKLRAILMTLVPEIPLMGERPMYADDFVLKVKVYAGDLREARAALASSPDVG